MIGHVDGSELATTRRFDVVLVDGAALELDDLVVTRQPHDVADQEVAHYGIVVECQTEIEGAQFPSDTERIAGTRTMPGSPTRTATAKIVYAR